MRGRWPTELWRRAVKMALHRREAVVHAVERIDTKAPVDVIGLIGVRQPDRVQVELMKVDRVRLLRKEIGRIAVEGTAIPCRRRAARIGAA